MRKYLIAALVMALGLAASIPALCSSREVMIDGLSELPVLSPEEAEALPEPQGVVRLVMDETSLPYDTASNTYFIPQSVREEHFEGRVEIDSPQGWFFYLCRSTEADKQHSLANSVGYTIYGVSGDRCIASKLIFTSLPAMCITTESGELPDDEDGRAELALFSAEFGTLWLDRSFIEINIRGNTSRRLPKKSYRVKIIDELGDKQNLSIADLRSDDDWILNPLYADTSKIRERLAYDLWADMNSSGQLAASSRMEYVEVFINGDYWGLYGVQERIDRKQVDASKRSGILYKVMANDRPSVEELLECTSAEVCRGFELEHAGAGITDPWEPAAAYIAALNGEESDIPAALSLENAIDYGLWAMLTQAHDCHFKNQFLNCVYSGASHTIYKIPWDLNNTFGDVWINDAEETNYTDYRIGSFVMDSGFELLINSGDPEIYEKIRERWTVLRAGAIREETILADARALHESLYPAIERDSRRWPECGMGDGNARNIRDIEDFIRTMLPRMDEYVGNLGNSKEMTGSE